MHSTDDPVLGAFALAHELGRGGQGAVWRGRHVDTGAAVAIKVLIHSRAGEASVRQAFRREVRAAARLDHPNVVMVLDQGDVPEGVLGLPAGSPYLVMELARCSLADLRGPWGWASTRGVLRGVLRGLAHAHARGVLHRDIKPGNILFAELPDTPEDAELGRLADFGLAVDRHAGVASGRRVMAGSPSYMAPEQISGDAAELGVETDLYAVGWVAWELAAGVHPLHALELADVRALKLSGRLPARPDHASVPDGFWDWVMRLLEPDPLLRFPSAAAALGALDALPDDAPEPVVRATMEPSGSSVLLSEPTYSWDPSAGIDLAAPFDPSDASENDDSDGVVAGPTPATVGTWLADDLAGALGSVVEGTPLEDAEIAGTAPMLLPVPAVRPHRPRDLGWPLLGAGLGLFGVRLPRVVGRDTVLDAVWTALHTCSSRRQSRCVMLRGPSGVGCSRLVEELGYQAAATGAAWVWAMSAADGSAALSQMLARFFGTVGMGALDRERRVARRLRHLGVFDPVDRAAVLRLVAGQASMRGALSARDAQAAVAVLARALEQRGLLLVLVDDVLDVDPTALAAVSGLGGRVCLVLSARDDDWVRRDTARVDALSPDVVAVGPLESGELRRSLEQAAGLAPSFAAAVAEESAGRVGLAREVTADLVARRGLVPTAEGLVAAPDVAWSVGDGEATTAFELALDRLASRASLAAAATLGMTVSTADWTKLAGILGLESGALDDWLDAGLVVSSGAGWVRFAHPSLRRRALARVGDNDARAELHGAAATVLAARGAEPEQVASLWLEAGRAGAAWQALGVEAAAAGGGPSELKSLAALAERCGEELGLVEEGLRNHALAVLRGRAAVQDADYATAARLVAGVAARRGTADAVGRGARLVQALVALGVMDLDQLQSVGEALLPSLPAGAPDRVRLLLAMGTGAAFRGAAGQGRPVLEAALESVDQLPDGGVLGGRIRVQLALVEKTAGHVSTALLHNQEAVRVFEALGARRWLAQALNQRGELLRKKGDLDRAAEAYARAEDLASVMGSVHAVVPRINLGLVELARERFATADRVLRLTLQPLRSRAMEAHEYAVRYALLASTAGLGDGVAFDAEVARVVALSDTVRFADADLAACADQAERLWLALGDTARADAAAALAIQQRSDG